MNDLEWLCKALLQLDDFATDRRLARFRRALSEAADMALIDIMDQDGRIGEVVVPMLEPTRH